MVKRIYYLEGGFYDYYASSIKKGDLVVTEGKSLYKKASSEKGVEAIFIPENLRDASLAERSRVYREMAERTSEYLASNFDTGIIQVHDVASSTLPLVLHEKLKAGTPIVVELVKLDGSAYALLKEITAISQTRPIILFESSLTPKSAKLRRIIVEYVAPRLSLDRGIYALSLGRSKYFGKARKWIIKVENFISEIKIDEINDVKYRSIIESLKTRSEEVKNIIKGTPFTVSFNSLKDLRMKGLKSAKNTLKPLVSLTGVSLVRDLCFMSNDIADPEPLHGCEVLEDLESEIIMIGIIKLKPVIESSIRDTGKLYHAYSMYIRNLRKHGEKSLHPLSPIELGLDYESWTTVPLFATDKHELSKKLEQVIEELASLREFLRLIGECSDYIKCSNLFNSHSVARFEQVLTKIETYKHAIDDYRTLSSILEVKPLKEVLSINLDEDEVEARLLMISEIIDDPSLSRMIYNKTDTIKSLVSIVNER